MLNDMKLRSLKPREKLYKVADRDGMYVAVMPSGVLSFRFDYRLNGRRETLTIGAYGPAGLTLAEARERTIQARRMLLNGVSPAADKRRRKTAAKSERTFGSWAREWVEGYRMAETTRIGRRGVLQRDILTRFERRQLAEITEVDIRALCDQIVKRGAPSTAVQVRDVIYAVFQWAKDKGNKTPNPAADIRPSAIATFVPRDRALSPTEIGIAFRLAEQITTYPTNRLALRLVLLTMVRKGMLIGATWDEVDFEKATWTIPKERMKVRRPHVVYLSQQALDILSALQTCAGSSRYLLPAAYGLNQPISQGTLNKVTAQIIRLAQEQNQPLAPFTVHDLRRTASTILHEAGFLSDWIEKCLSHEQQGVRAVYNKAEYAEGRRDMLQQWADMVDSWIDKGKVVPFRQAH